ncbi:specifically androgen-regulated gene protein [Octodon degus]|uniref:Specifically androgen-regulated gene protein n=1 Tax=Octodon degus TaxID=10160 RepID=A0A6P6DAW1_OCTDE|nr:specifically androgen-regulated gene protein [Octodon degus]
MPERELWPEGPGSEPGTRVGSHDSMMSTASVHSGSSDHSYDFLSAEEKECLLFLEETIGSLDAEADSVLPTDKSEPSTTPQGFGVLSITPLAPHGNSEETVTLQRPEPRTVTEASSSYPPEAQGLGRKSGSYSLPRNIHIGGNQNLRQGTTQTNSYFSARVSEGHLAKPKEGAASQSSEPHRAPASPRRASLHLDTVLIPPPKAFQDGWPEQGGKDSLPKGPGEQSHTPPKTAEAMSNKASKKVTPDSPGQPQPPPAQPSQDARAKDTPLSSGDDANAHLAPLTAPKPRKLPPNIVLKSSRSSFHSEPQSWLSRHTEAGDTGHTSSSLQEQRKARREALKKLGLPQDEEEPSRPLSHPASFIRPKKPADQGPAAVPAPAQPAALTPASAALPAAGKAPVPTMAPVGGPSPVKVPAPAPAPASSPGKACVGGQEAPPGQATAHKSMPIPIPKTSKASSPLTKPKPDSGLTLQESSIPGLKQMNFKFNTLERSGVGLSSYLSAEKDPSPKTSTSLGKDSVLQHTSPSVLRNSRPRPASLGTGKDFAGIQVGRLADLEQGQSSKRLSYQGQSPDKLPRPLCVSVKISPKGVPDEHRRQALKKLGLLKE